jgi:uncharacterized membrane protein
MTPEQKDTRTRSLLKSASYIVVHEIILLVVAYAFTGNLALAAGIVLTATLLEATFYYVHERVWANLKIGRK